MNRLAKRASISIKRVLARSARVAHSRDLSRLAERDYAELVRPLSGVKGELLFVFVCRSERSLRLRREPNDSCACDGQASGRRGVRLAARPRLPSESERPGTVGFNCQ